MKRWDQFLTEREMNDIGAEPMGPGEFPRDPDKPDHTQDLMAALKEIIQVAKKALDMREKGLGDKSGNGDPNDENDDDSMNNLVSRPDPDSAEKMFGSD